MSGEDNLIENLSADELFEIAQKKKEEEEKSLVSEIRQQIADLKKQRSALLREHQKALATLDAEIEKLSASLPGKSKSTKPAKARVKKSAGIGDAIMQMMSNKPISTGDIRDSLQAAGVDTKYLSQTLSYLKSKGKISSPSRNQFVKAG